MKIQGNWASPDCGKYSEALVMTKSFYLKSVKGGLILLPLSKTADKRDYWMISFGGAESPVRLEDDSILKIGFFGEKRATPKEWEKLPLDHHLEYTGCTDTPKIVPKMMDRLMRYIDRIHAECTVGLSNDCARVIFKMSDANNDKKITPSEIKRTVATSILVAELAAKQKLSQKEIDDIAATSKTASDELAAEMMSTLDKNNSKDLDYNEVVENFSAPKSPLVKETLEKLGKLFPAFRVVALGL